eukprot:12286153-Alexandrium_andersonii.AAC.1
MWAFFALACGCALRCLGAPRAECVCAVRSPARSQMIRCARAFVASHPLLLLLGNWALYA